MKLLQKFYNNKQVLVTGGAGFIGSHLVEKLVELGARVTILDNFFSGKLSHLKTIVHAINIIYADIRSAYSCLKATARKDIVFHLASFISVPGSAKHPELCNSTNVEGTKKLLEVCVENDVKTFVFSSSSAVYGDRQTECKEDDQLNPLSPYAKSKVEGERLCQKYTEEHNLNVARLRYFNVYGKNQNPHGPYAAVVAKFTDQLLSKQPLTIFGDGKQTRDFVHVSKVVEANLITATQENLNGEVFNIGSKKSVNLFRLIEQLEKELKVKKTKINFLPARQGDIVNSNANCEKYSNFLAKIS